MHKGVNHLFLQLDLILQSFIKLLIAFTEIKNWKQFLRYIGLPNGQEKSWKTKKNDKKSGKNGVFENSQEKFLKTSNIVSSNFPNSLYLKAIEW